MCDCKEVEFLEYQMIAMEFELEKANEAIEELQEDNEILGVILESVVARCLQLFNSKECLNEEVMELIDHINILEKKLGR